MIDPSAGCALSGLPFTAGEGLQLAIAGLVPSEIQVRSSLLFQLLQPLADEVGFALHHSETLATLDAVKQSLVQLMM